MSGFYMHLTEASMLKLIFRTFGMVSLALLLNTGLQAQTTVMTTGITGSSALPTPSPQTSSTMPSAGDFNTLPSTAISGSKVNPVAPKPDVMAARTPVRVAANNQFQQFVQETTGRILPVFGSDLFATPETYAANAALPAPDNYVLGPGDEVQLRVFGSQDFGANLELDRNGQVSLPKVGTVTLAGVAVRDLEKTLTGHLSKIFNNIKVSATLGRLRSIQVYVVGQAQQPGTFLLSSLSTMVNALFASGGPGANGSMRTIDLKRAGKTVATLDLYDFIANGDKSHDLPLLSGDVIVIPPVGPRVAITGAFDQAAIYELKPGMNSIAEILSLGGGVPVLATNQKALLERITPTHNPPRQVVEVVLDPSGLRQSLQDGDVLTLLGISPAFANAVTLQGTVASPLRYRWFEDMKILDLIPERDALITGDYYKRKNLLVQNAEVAKLAGGNVSNQLRGMVDQINWEYAVIQRLDRTTLTTQLLPFNLGKAVLHKDPDHNLLLYPGDVVTILNQNDMKVPQERQSRLVHIEGEVLAPGVYQSLPGETLPQIIARVGGLTPQAYVFGIEFSRHSIRTRQQENLDILIRRLETQSQSNSLTANRTGMDAANAAVVLQQQQAQLKSQTERLKSFKSNGRLALELDPNSQSLTDLPALPLEDDDRILVPSRPGFVAALGSVNNENVFIYKPGKTVSDVIKSAGLTEDAEPAQAFVLRADGSIVARVDRGGFFGIGFDSLAVMPGDTVVVPAQMDRESRYNAIIRGFKDWTQILSNLGLGVAAFKSMGY